MGDNLDWVPRLDDRTGALYRAIADALADDVASGRLSAGARLPTHRRLAEALDVTVGTVTRAYAEAERRGLVDATVGRGTFVRGPDVADWASSLPPDRACFDRMSPTGWHAQVAHEVAAEAERPEPDDAPVDLSVNYPVSSFLAPAVARGLPGLGDSARLAAICGYQPSNGRAEHRAAAARWLARFGLEARADDLVLVNGTQGGLAVTLQALARPGDTLLVESLTWAGIHSLAQFQGVRLVPVTTDAGGLDPDALRDAARRTGAKLAYCMPTLHNPTNVTTDTPRRRALLRVAREEGLLLVEDDIYGFLADDAPPPLAALDPERAIYVTSLSKNVAPGLRIGFLKGPERLTPRFAAAMRATNLSVCSFSAEIAMHLIDGGHAAQAADAQKAEARARLRIAERALQGLGARSAPTSFHLWLPLPETWTTAGFTAEAANRGVAVTPGTAFTADGSDPHAVRLCVCAARDRRALRRGVETVAALTAEQPQSRLPVV